MPYYGAQVGVFNRKRLKHQNKSLAVEPKDLLEDAELRIAVRMKNFQPKSYSEYGSLRHDCCVLLCQHDAFQMRGEFRTPPSRRGINGQDIVTPTTTKAEDTLHSSADTLRGIAESTRFEDMKDNGHTMPAALVNSTWALKAEQENRTVELTTLWGLKETHWLRARCLKLSSHPAFDLFILALILINCVLMALEHPSSPRDLQKVIAVCDEVFLYIFTGELGIKVIALGLLFGPKTYLRDIWNRLDMMVVCIGWIGLVANQLDTCGLHGLLFCAVVKGSSKTSFSILRTIRMLRPLRTIRRFPNLKKLVVTIIRAAPRLSDSAILFAFVLVFFGNISVQLYKGAFLQHCVNVATGMLSLQEPTRCMKNGKVGDRWGGCAPGHTCQEKVGLNLNDGVTSFDNFGTACLAIVQTITLEGWASLMYAVRQVRGLQHDIFSLILVLFGSMFLINLVVAIIVATYFESQDAPEVSHGSSSMDSFTNTLQKRSSREIVAELGEAEIAGKDCCEVRLSCLRICTSVWFEELMMLLIVGNTLLLALENIIADSALNIGNDIFTGVFVVEMIMKIIAFGPQLYFKDPRNKFDSFVAVVSVIDSILTWSGAGISLAALRTCRMLRIFKLARSLTGLQRIIQTLWASIGPIRDLGLLMLLFLFVCALVGKSLFMCTEDEKNDPEAKWSFVQSGYYEGKLERPNFSSFYSAITTTFILITGENWNEIMYIGVAANGWATSFFFLFVVAVGNYVLVNLFLAILIGNWVAEKNRDGNRRSRISLAKSGGIVDSLASSLGITFRSDQEDSIDETSNPTPAVSRASLGHSEKPGRHVSQTSQTSQTWDRYYSTGSMASSLATESTSPRTAKINKRRSQKEIVLETGLKGSSLCCIPADNAIRDALWRVVSHPYFDNLTYGLIALSAVVLALDTPDESYPDGESVFHAMDFVLTCLFSLEALIKIFVYGCFGSHGYFREPWNLLDFLVVVISVLNLVTAGGEKSFAWFKALRALRALRPLRMVSRNRGMRAVVDAVITAIPDIVEVFLVLSVFLLIFSILGVQLFKNKLNRCSCMEWCPEKRFNPTSGRPSPQLCNGECSTAPLHEKQCKWERHPHFSFDNVFYALLVLFEIATLEMWPDVMWLAVDGVNKDEGPLYDHSPLAAIYFIVFIFVMAFFIMNLFVGVVIDKFTKCHKQIKGEGFLSRGQLQWIKTQQSILKIRPKMLMELPDSRCRQLALQLIDLREFEYVIVALIVANIGTMCLNGDHLSAGSERLLDNANTIFVTIFVGEALLKIFALQPNAYFKDLWNSLDFLIVVTSILQIVTDFMEVDTTVLRMFRICRMFRLVKSLQALRELFQTLVLSLPSLANVGSLLLLLFFVYAVAGMALFGDILIEDNPDLQYMNKDVNFSSFYIAMMMLFRMSTGESWNGIMHDCFSGQRCKAPPHEKNCGSTPVAVTFFLTFMLMGSFVFLNLFVAVIVQNLSDQDEDDSCLDIEPLLDERSRMPKIIIKDSDLEKFADAWSNFAPNGSWYAPTSQLLNLLRSIPPPLGFKGDHLSLKLQFRLLRALGLLDHDNRIHFAETLFRLAAAACGEDVTHVADTEVLQRVNHAILRLLPVPSSVIVYLAVESVAVLKIQKAWRKTKSATWRKLCRTVSKMFVASRQVSESPPAMDTPMNESGEKSCINSTSEKKVGPLVQVVTCSQPLLAVHLRSMPPHLVEKEGSVEAAPSKKVSSDVASETTSDIDSGWLKNVEGSPVGVEFPALERFVIEADTDEGMERFFPSVDRGCEAYCNPCGGDSHRNQVEVVMVEKAPIAVCIPRNAELTFSPREVPVAHDGTDTDESVRFLID